MPTTDRRHSGPFLGGLLVLLIAFAAMYTRSAPPDPLSRDASSREFSAGRAGEVLRGLVGDHVPHPIGTGANARVRDRVVEAFRQLGYPTKVQASFVCGTNAVCGTVHNVIAQRAGRRPGPAVLLATHHDSVPSSPGASDAAVSVAVVLEIARALKDEPPHRNPIIFLVDDGEEAGLLGAEAFASEHPLAKQVGAVVNLEARGTSGSSVMFETSGENAWLVRLLARSLSQPMASSLFYPIYERLPNDTDLTVFKRHGMRGVNFAFIGDVARYHTPLDNVEYASPASLQHQGQNALAMVRALVDEDLDVAQPGHAVFFDVLGFGIVRWPRGLTLPLAGVSALLVLVVIMVMRRRHAAPLWRAVVGVVAWLLMVAVAAAAGWGMWRALARAGAWPGEATTRPVVAVLAFWLLGIALVLLIAAVFERWARRAGAWAGCWLCWSLAACVAAFYVPEASYLLVVPALVAGLAGLVSVIVRPEPMGFCVAALPLLAAAVLWMPPAWFLFDALGPPTLPAIAGAVAVMGTALFPLVVAAGRARWVVPLVALAGAGALALISWRAPAFSADRPERMNVAFLQFAEDGDARWVVSPQSRVLPSAMRQAAPFGADLIKAFPWSERTTAFAAPTPERDLAAPGALVVERNSRGAQRRVRLQVTSPRGARVVMLLLPEERVVSVAINGREIPARARLQEQRSGRREPGSGLRSYTCVTVPPEGIEYEVVVTGAESVEGYLVDQTSGLPPGGDALVRARPREATAIQSGDVTMLGRRVAL